MNKPNTDYETYGKITVIEETQTFASGFSKREFVIEIPGDYPQLVKFQMLKERADVLESMAVGQMVSVNANVEGREYNGKYFVNLTAWKVVAETPAPVKQEQPASAAPVSDDEEETGEIPF
tara:strand:+ start:15415 stop:15777 length:363 start_codon:yes stop_codon:yes gene_type:complete